jgi:hypothetical protein
MHSQSTQEPHARILAPLDATDRRLARIGIVATNRAASAALATACEPHWNGNCFLTSTQRISPNGAAE